MKRHLQPFKTKSIEQNAFKHDLTWSWVYFSTAAGVPGTGVGSRWLECLTSNPNASLFSGSMLPRLLIFMSALTHSDQVFLGLPLLLALGIVILVMELMHEEERAKCPYHLKRLVRRAAVTSCTPNIAQSVFGHFVTISDSADPADHWSVFPAKPLQVWCSRCPGFTTMQFGRTQTLKTFPWVLTDTYLDVRILRIGRSSTTSGNDGKLASFRQHTACLQGSKSWIPRRVEIYLHLPVWQVYCQSVEPGHSILDKHCLDPQPIFL